MQGAGGGYVNATNTAKIVGGMTENVGKVADEGINHLLDRFKGLDDASISKLSRAADEGIINPNAWKGNLISKSGDITHLTERELIEINKALKDGKHVDTDKILQLRDQAEDVADSYGKKLSEVESWKVSRNYAPSIQDSTILSKELEKAGISRPADVEAHHIVPVKQGNSSEDFREKWY